MDIVITDVNFDKILKTDKPILVDFWAPWCGPCKALGPIIEELAKDYEGQAIIGKCNVDENDDLPVKYGIRSIPTMLFFKEGKLVDRLTGLNSKEAIATKLDALK